MNLPQNRIGFRKREGEYVEYLIPPSTFKDVVCAGYDRSAIRDALIERGLMEAGNDKKHRGQRQIRLPDLGQSWVYVIRIHDPEGVHEWELDLPSPLV
jgi:hypothetical protein